MSPCQLATVSSMKHAYWINVKMESSSYPNTSAAQYNSIRDSTSESFKLVYFFFYDSKPRLGQSLHVMEASRSHSDTTTSRTPLDESSARRRDPYMTTQNTVKKQTSMPPAGFEPTIPEASGRRPTH